MNIENEIDFILSHFENSLFPRTMMTKRYNYQFLVNSRDEIIQKCLESNLIDCRINAYPSYVKWEKYDLIRYPPNFIFIDLDLWNFNHEKRKLDLALKNILKKMMQYRSIPTVLWTGNGYHIYLPIKAIILDQEEIFSKDRFPNLFSTIGKYSNWSVSEVFLKYAEIFFTNGKADPLHNPKFKTCLIRIPGSYNSKPRNKAFGKEESLVKIIQRWNGTRMHIQFLLKDFRRWLIQEDLDQRIINSRGRQDVKLSKRFFDDYEWIEILLQTPLEDHRRYCLFHILVPYLINIRNLSLQESANILYNWLSKCNKVKPLDFSPLIEIKNRIKYVKDYKPMSLAKLRMSNVKLYQLLNIK